MDNKEGTLQFCITSLWHLATTHLSLVYEHWNVLDVLKNKKKMQYKVKYIIRNI